MSQIECELIDNRIEQAIRVLRSQLRTEALRVEGERLQRQMTWTPIAMAAGSFGLALAAVLSG